MEQRHLQLSDEASLSGRFSLSFFLLQDQIAALYITKELPASPASVSLLTDVAVLFLKMGQAGFLLTVNTNLNKNETYKTDQRRPRVHF